MRAQAGAGPEAAAGLDLLFLTQTYPRFPGDGAGPFIRDLALGLARGGDRVTVLVPHAEGVVGSESPVGSAGAGETTGRRAGGWVRVVSFRYAPQSWEVLGYGRSLEADERVKGKAALVAPLYALAARRAVARQVAARRFDLVHAHWLVPNAVAAAPLRRRPPAPGRSGRPAFAAGLHGSDVFLAERPGVRRAARFALGRTDLLTGCSPELVDRVCALGFPRERSAVIPYGVDVAAFSPGRERGRGWRERLGIPAEAPLVLGVGRMATKKGFHVLMEALPSVLAARPEVHVVLAGGGDRLAELRAAASRWPGRVHLPGPARHDELPDLFRAADLFVMPAVHDPAGNVDGLPNVVLEAMASGLPVVASRVSGIPLAVEDQETGLLVPEADAAALAAALARLLGDPAAAREMGERGRRRAEAELTWDAVAARYRQAYLAALSGPVTRCAG